ncbi:hypothetical protein CDAR_125321 [Caerostris darwini]|uniref:Uncharacterized protein n=1 Tax=Caerostris darwini TaxID=1538125 RepID=A0AAV4Q3I9_9ARAC|nr:hypothetical protein CDAR_125321 [Caerostris darwini]
MKTAVLTKDISFNKLSRQHISISLIKTLSTLPSKQKKAEPISWPSHLLRLHQPTLLLTATVTPRPCICLSAEDPCQELTVPDQYLTRCMTS